MITAALTSLGREAARIVLPSWCVSCRERLPWSERVGSCCARCWNAMPRFECRCMVCAIALEIRDSNVRCIECSSDAPPFDWVDAWGRYSGSLERVIHAFKFERHDFLDRSLADLLTKTYVARGDFEFDTVVPVPMHRTKLRKRGYNQAELLARHFAKAAALPLDAGMLTKTRASEMQSTLPRDARARNVRGSFAAGTDVSDRSILIIDDICTTTETLRACASALKKAGAKRVCALTLARA